jgi:hypothetical protein
MPGHTPPGKVLASLDRLDEPERMNDGTVRFIDSVSDVPAHLFRLTADGHK